MSPIILLVDDEILAFLERISKHKYTILKADNGSDAVSKLECEARLIASDLMMPEMDVFTSYKTLKPHFEHSHIPVILLTASTSSQSQVEDLELKSDAYIEKTFSKETPSMQISRLLTKRKKLRAYLTDSPFAHPQSSAHTKTNERFLKTLKETIYNNLEDPELSVEMLAKTMNMSRATLYRKIKAISDLSAIELVNTARLKRAAELLAEGNYRICEISALVGFSSQSNFARNFLKQFGMTPTKYISSQ